MSKVLIPISSFFRKIYSFFKEKIQNLSVERKNKLIKFLLIFVYVSVFSLILYVNAVESFSSILFYSILFLFFSLVVVGISYFSNKGILELKNLYPVGFMIFIVSFYCIWTYNKNFPVSEGWYTLYAEYILSGKVPYVDFELLFPPIYTYIITFVVAIFGKQIIVLRIMGVLLLIATAYLIYKIFNLFVNSYVSSICSISSIFLMQSQVVASIYYDYINFYNLFNYLGIYYLMKFFFVGQTKKIFKKFDTNILLAGSYLAVALLIRQSSGLINLFFGLCVIIFTMIITKSKNKFNQLSSYCLGIFIPVVILSIFMLFNKSLFAFINYTFIIAPAAKGGVGNALFRWIEYTFTKEMLITSVICIFAFVLLSIGTKKFNEKHEVINDFDENTYKIYAGLFTSIFISIILFRDLNWDFYSFGSWDLINILYMFSMLIFFGYSFYLLVRFLIGKTISSYDCIIVTISGFVFATQFGSCTSGGTSQGQGALSIGLVLALIYVVCRNFKIKLVYKYAVVSIALIFSISCFTRVNVNSYNWWGLLQGNYYDQQHFIENIEMLDGLKVSAGTKNMYEGIVNTIKKDLEEEDQVYCFPQIPIFYSLVDKLPCGVKSVVPWFDVSIQSTLREDLEYLKTEKPKYIVVAYTPDWVIGGHENAFNSNEHSVQRDFYSYFQEEKAKGEYIVVANYNLNADTGGEYYPIEVLRYIPNYEERNLMIENGFGKLYDYLYDDRASNVLSLTSTSFSDILPGNAVYNVEEIFDIEYFSQELLLSFIMNNKIKYLFIDDSVGAKSSYISILYDLYSTNYFTTKIEDKSGCLYIVNDMILDSWRNVEGESVRYDDSWISKSYFKTFRANGETLVLKVYLPSFIGESRVKIIIDGKIYNFNFTAQDNEFIEIKHKLDIGFDMHSLSIQIDNNFSSGDGRDLGSILSEFTFIE